MQLEAVVHRKVWWHREFKADARKFGARACRVGVFTHFQGAVFGRQVRVVDHFDVGSAIKNGRVVALALVVVNNGSNRKDAIARINGGFRLAQVVDAPRLPGCSSTGVEDQADFAEVGDGRKRREIEAKGFPLACIFDGGLGFFVALGGRVELHGHCTAAGRAEHVEVELRIHRQVEAVEGECLEGGESRAALGVTTHIGRVIDAPGSRVGRRAGKYTVYGLVLIEWLPAEAQAAFKVFEGWQRSRRR